MQTSDEEGLQDLPLPALFERGRSAHAKAETLSPAEPDTQQLLQNAVAALRRCDVLVDSLGVFSSNEEVEDISTQDLKYLLVAAFLGDLLAQSNVRDPEQRREALLQAVQSYARFLQRCEQYSLVSEEAKTNLNADGSMTQQDPTTKRLQKIARFKREKALQEQLQEVQMQRMRQRRMAELDEEEDGGAQSGGASSLDEDFERQTWLMQVELAALKATEQIQMLQQEVEMLKHAASIPEDERNRPRPGPPPELMEQLMAAARGLEGPSREQRRQEVFRPSHNLPTVSLAQHAQLEMQAAKAAEDKQRMAQAAAHEVDSDSDEAVFKQRAMDDWKDEHPTGWGNSKLRPTA
ncbi:hypothetical protein WJX72_003617 [[Myrmecia] bisecta]|uniref:Uncharacterized protein n=1 Tax=[Myrmecia] bisecta TaxID=41462 RepID=A0AAW1P3Y4_9CHLO